MTFPSTALAACLLLVCLSCHETNKKTKYTHQTVKDVTIPDIKREVSGKISPPPPPKTPSKIIGVDRGKELIKINNEGTKDQNIATPPVIKKDEEVRAEKKPADTINEEFNTEDYSPIIENNFISPLHEPLSTFSIDVDAASYSNIRRFIQNGNLPPAGAVRIEEMINYFDYSYPFPKNDTPFSINTELSVCPWHKDHKIIHIGLQGKQLQVENLPPSNLVFLIDVSGSMDEPNKLPLVKTALYLLVEQLREKDQVAIVVYAGSAGLVLPLTKGSEKTKIKDAIEQLEAGGSTAGGEGIQLAYKIASDHFIKGGNNRVILATDGDFNVGASSDDELVRMIEKNRESGVYLSVLGFGYGNYKDNKMQLLADKGNGNHYYIDGIAEARKVFVSEFGGTLYTIAKDVKIQIEFNPAMVKGYRLIGYENRVMAAEDFNNDRKDAGELGSGHRVTALYEIITADSKEIDTTPVDALKYQTNGESVIAKESGEIMTIKFRYKKPQENTSHLITLSVKAEEIPLNKATANFRFASAVAEFGLLLRNSEYKGNANFKQVIELARASRENDLNGYRQEFINLVQKAAGLVSR